MIPTAIGLMVMVAGLLVSTLGPSAAAMSMLMLCGLMSGSAAIQLTALGNSSIPPIQLALAFLVLRVFLSRKEFPRLSESIRANWALLAFVAYGIVGAFALPRIFARAMQVPPLRFAGLDYIYATVPLGPSSQNITTTVYLVGTLLIAICVHVVIRTERGPVYFLRTAIALAWIHIFLGVSALALKGTPADAFFAFFRNGSYAQLDQSYGGFIRLTGISPEPSAYAAYAFGWFVLIFECWQRGLMPRATGLTSIALAILLVLSTSGLAYMALAGYLVILIGRSLIPGSSVVRRMPYLLGALLAILTLVSVACLTMPSLATAFGDMFYHMTVDKGGSESGLQRAFWAKKGLEAFWVSSGLGIGPGSFRSSSLFTAILGSMGILGAICFAIYVVQVLKPLRASTFNVPNDPLVALGAAASWAAFVGLIPASIGSPSTDPGVNFATFSAVALALRAKPILAWGRIPVRRGVRTEAAPI